MGFGLHISRIMVVIVDLYNLLLHLMVLVRLGIGKERNIASKKIPVSVSSCFHSHCVCK